jgi:hypothetical protein
MKNLIVLSGCIAAMLCMEFYSLYPYHQMIKPFPFNDQELSLQSHVDYTAWRIGMCIMFFLVWWLNGKQWWGLALLLLACGYLVDYRLTYNGGFGNRYLFGHKVSLSYTLFMVLSLAGISLKMTYDQWKT